jgi:Tfp pilus assembly protein PilO
MNGALRRLRFEAAQLGMVGWLGAALLVAAAIYAGVVVPQQDSTEAEMRQEIGQLRQRIAAEQARQVGALDNGPAAVERFFATLPRQSEVPAALRGLQELADKDGVVLEKKEYRYADTLAASGMSSAAKPVAEVAVLLSARAPYGRLRSFLADAFARYPALALDGMALKRERIGAGDVSAGLHLALFFRKDA